RGADEDAVDRAVVRCALVVDRGDGLVDPGSVRIGCDGRLPVVIGETAHELLGHERGWRRGRCSHYTSERHRARREQSEQRAVHRSTLERSRRSSQAPAGLPSKEMKIGVLAVQGNFREHGAMLRRLGADVVEVRKPEQVDDLDGLVVPGGESTTFMRLMKLYGLDEAIRAFAASILGTCA